MNLRPRFLLALLIAGLLALPGISSEGGGNASGTGVWILPRPSYVGLPSAGTTGVSTMAPLAVPSLAVDVTLTTSSELGQFSATLVDPVSGSPLSLAVLGRDVVLPRSVLQGLLASGTTTAHIVIADSSQLGYVVRLAIDPATASATLTLP